MAENSTYSITAAKVSTAAVTAESITHAMRSLIGSMSKIRGKQSLVVSPGFLAKLREQGADEKYEVKRFGGASLSLCGFDLIESSEQLKKRKLVSCDSFVEYDEKDADWAVPLGFAKWVTVDVDALLMNSQRHFEDQILFGRKSDEQILKAMGMK